MRRFTSALAVVGSAACLLSGCNTDQSFIFPDRVEGVPGIVDLGTLEIVPPPEEEIEDFNLAAAYYAPHVIYSELGPTGTPEYGGVTFDLVGTGGDICVFLDPETVGWNAVVSPTTTNFGFSWPDNLFDDGDLDIKAGFSVSYSGSPGVNIGTFDVLVEDQLGIDVSLDFSECFIFSPYFGDGAHSGRAMPEFCTLSTTVENVGYTVLLEQFTLPQDDSRLSYGLLVVEGTCPEFLERFLLDEAQVFPQECIITGESLKPGNNLLGARAAEAGLSAPAWIGDEKPTWPGSEDIEAAFCGRTGNRTLADVCEREADALLESGGRCSEHLDPQGEGVDRCYCGDPQDIPSSGF